MPQRVSKSCSPGTSNVQEYLASDRDNEMSSKTKKILIVDDNEVNLLVAEKVVELGGFGTLCANSGMEAIRIFERENPDLVLMDLSMPEMDGYQAASRILEIQENQGRIVPIVALTSYTDSHHFDRCMKSGFKGFLTKPAGIDEVISTINELLEPAG